MGFEQYDDDKQFIQRHCHKKFTSLLPRWEYCTNNLTRDEAKHI